MIGNCDPSIGSCICLPGFNHSSVSSNDCGGFDLRYSDNVEGFHSLDVDSQSNDTIVQIYSYSDRYQDSLGNIYHSFYTYQSLSDDPISLPISRAYIAGFTKKGQQRSWNHTVSNNDSSIDHPETVTHTYHNIYTQCCTLILANRYRLLRKIGAGGFGIIFEGQIMIYHRPILLASSYLYIISWY